MPQQNVECPRLIKAAIKHDSHFTFYPHLLLRQHTSRLTDTHAPRLQLPCSSMAIKGDLRWNHPARWVRAPRLRGWKSTGTSKSIKHYSHIIIISYHSITSQWGIDPSIFIYLSQCILSQMTSLWTSIFYSLFRACIMWLFACNYQHIQSMDNSYTT